MSGYKNLDDLKKSIHAQMEILTIQEKYVATLEENMKGGKEIVANEYIAEKDSDAAPIKIGQFAKIIRDKGVPFGRNKIHSWLNNRGYTYRIKDKNFVKSEYIVKGLFEIRGYSLYITPEGVSYFTKRLLKEFNIEEW